MQISDMVLTISSIMLMIYCANISKRIKKLSNLETDIGAAIAILSNEVDSLQAATQKASRSIKESANHNQNKTQDMKKTEARIRFERNKKPTRSLDK